MIKKASINEVDFEINELSERCNLSLFLKGYNIIYNKTLSIEDIFSDEGTNDFIDFMFDSLYFKETIESDLWVDNSLMTYLIPNFFFKIKKISSTNKNLIIKHSFESFLNNIGIENILSTIILKEESSIGFEIGNQKTYVIYDYDRDLYKIGKSNNPEQRVKALSIHGTKLSLILLNENNIEHHLHERFKLKKSNREWFSLDADDLLELIEKYNFTEYKTTPF